jgi:hypothetical protein
MIVAVIALVVALGGTAVAAKQISLSALANGAKNKTVGVGKLTYVNATKTVSSSEATASTVTATCPPGTHVVGGGVKGENPDEDFVFDSYPTATGWSARVFAGGTGNTRTFIATAICGVSRSVTGAPAG